MKTVKKFFTVILVLLIVFCFALPSTVSADVTEMSETGVVTTLSTSLRMRESASTSATILDNISQGAIVSIIGKTEDSDSNEWYKISYGGREGYVMAKYVTVLSNSATNKDDDFETSIADFPESYKPYLRTLHSLHPTWVFTPLNTGILWDTLMERECVTGRNLIQSPVSWKSYEKGAYDWDNGTWYSFDSGGWVQACEEAIGYYLDPRNFLSGDIYQFLLLSDDGATVDTNVINGMLQGTFMYYNYDETDEAKAGIKENELTYAEMIIKAAKEAGASPYLLAARIKQEQGSNGNKLAHGTVDGYEGYYNHFDIGAYAHNGRTAIVNGAIYAENKGWDSIYKAILGGAQFLVKSYISVGQDTLYLQKYDVVDGGNGYYAHQYMTNIKAAVDECAVLRKGIMGTEAENSALKFSIPVYTDMPENPQQKPGLSGSANNILSSLKVENHDFTVAFDKYTQEYEMFITSPVITVSATAYDSAATVKGTGTYTLQSGINNINITVTATNGNVRTYSITVNSTCEGAAKLGDVNGDGIINVIDLLIIKKSILKINELKSSDARFASADMNGDGTINVIDLLSLKKKILGIS